MNRSGVKLDDRTMSLIKMKCLPLTQLIQSIYPDLYRVDNLELAKTQVNYPNHSLYCPSTYTYIIYRIRIYIYIYVNINQFEFNQLDQLKKGLFDRLKCIE